jgi:hypothetical protein
MTRIVSTEGRRPGVVCQGREPRFGLMPWLVVGWACAALACGEEGSGDTGVGGQRNPSDDAQGGTGGERPPASAPACTTPNAAFLWVEVRGGPSLGPSQRVRFIERGFGSPPGFTELPSGASSPDQLGWLQVADVQGAADAGLDDAGPSAGPTRLIVGPRELGELPVSIDEVLVLSVELASNVFYGHHRIVLQGEDRVLLFHQVTSLERFGTFSGFTLEGGDALCAAPFPTAERRCADVYRNQLKLTVPGGATATLAPGQAQTVGDYRVLHGTTTTIERLPPGNAGDTGCSDVNSGNVELTAVL